MAGLIIAAFEHRDSRAGDPNLHTHITVSNKVCAVGPDGIPRWLALDGAALYRAIVAASEVYNTAMEGAMGSSAADSWAPIVATASAAFVRSPVSLLS